MSITSIPRGNSLPLHSSEGAYRSQWIPRGCKPSRLAKAANTFICRARTPLRTSLAAACMLTAMPRFIPTCSMSMPRARLIPSTTLPGFGFQNLSTLPRNQQTLQFTNNISPYLIKSFGSWADTELRYTFSSWNYGGNTVRYDLTVNTRSEQPRLLDAERRNFHRGDGPGFSEDGSAVYSGRRRNQWLIREPKPLRSAPLTISNTILPR